MQACLTLAKCSTGPCKPAWGWFTVYRGHASLRGADLLYIEAMQACAELIYCISGPCKPARSWFTVNRGHASLRGADLLYIEATSIGAKAFVFPSPGYICRR